MNSPTPVIASHVSQVLIDGQGVLLNRKTGKYLGLNAVGTQIVEMLQAGNTTEKITEHLASKYRMDKEIIAQDIAKFLEQAAKHQLLASSSEAATFVDSKLASEAAPSLDQELTQAGASAPGWMILRAYVLLFIVDWRLKYHEFDAVLDWLNNRTRKSQTAANSPETDRLIIQQVSHAMSTATKFYYRTRRDCLPNAMLAYYLMKSNGVPVKFCIGVTKFPFKGHAWVEYLGKVVYTTPASLWKYRAIMKV